MRETDAVQITFSLRSAKSRAERHIVADPTNPRSSLSPTARSLCLALYFDDLLQRGEAQNHADIARRFCVSRERVSQLMKLVYLAPDIQMTILSGTAPLESEVRVRSISDRLMWRDQRAPNA